MTTATPRANSDHTQIFVITLPGDEDRRAPLLAQLDRMGLRYELLFGVDGRSGLPAEHEGAVDRARARLKYRRDLSDGEFACALSHLAAYDQIVRRDLPAAIVLEDDAILKPAFGMFLKAGARDIGDLVLLDHTHARVRPRDGVEVIPGIRARRLMLPACLTTGYFITRSGARALLRDALPVSDVADWPQCAERLDMRALDPRIVDHPDHAEGASHLRTGRPGVRSDPRRFFKAGFWRRWFRKRMSQRIS